MPNVKCPECQSVLQQVEPDESETVHCHSCGAAFELYLFRETIASPGTPEIELCAPGEASCFFHSTHRVTGNCDECGRFLCTLCLIPLGAQNICPECLHRSSQSNPLRNYLLLYDNIALFLAIGPMLSILFAGFSLVTAPAALVSVFLFWRREKSAFRQPYIRFILAFLFGIGQVVCWVLLGIHLYHFALSHPDRLGS
jgi:hypothetical protein